MDDSRKFNNNSTRPENSTALCFFEAERIGYDIRASGIRIRNHVAVDVCCSADLIVSQPVRDRHRIHAVVDEHGSHGVPETVRIQMRQSVTLGKLRKP